MRKKFASRNTVLFACLFAGLIALALSQTLPVVMAKTVQPTARQQVVQAIDQASDSGQYRYDSTIVQTYHPTLLLENVGRTTRVETHKINGEVDVPADSMTLQIKAASNPSMQIKLEDGRGYGRFSEDDVWTEVDLATDLFAPGGDPLGFLAAAENVQIADGSLADGTFPAELLPDSLTSNITRYQFDVSGQKYAVAIRDQLKDQLIQSGELPPGVDLQLAQRYVDMTGSGEIWVYRGEDGRELPMRQIVQLDFPAQAGASEWVSAEITTAFSDWSKPTEALAVNNWPQDPFGTARSLAAAIFGNLSPETVRQVGLNGGAMLILLGGGALFFVNSRRRELRIALNLTLVISMLTVPFLQAQQASAQSEQIKTFNERQQARQEEFAQAQEAPAVSPAALPPANPLLAPALASSCVITATSDCDGDGLTDNVERYELGTNIEKVDTDGDGISDGREVASFEWFGTWTLDPLNPDSNGDGLDDGAECYTRSDTSNGVLVETDPQYWDIPCLDRDADEVPDVYDFDNDGDGVPDSIDLNPNASQVVKDNSMFQLDLVNAQPDQNIIVDLQIRPLNDQHLWWTNSIRDWPAADNQGQQQRMTANTMGNGDGDIQLMPMLEITIPYTATNPSGGLPVNGSPTITATTPISTWLDSTVTDKYAMTVRLGPNGERIANLPLIEITDPTGGSPVGWQARIPYRLQTSVTGWGNPHEMRVVWFVNGQQDSCTPPANAAANYCEDSANWTSITTLLQTYPETFRITGLSVSEHHGATTLLAGQTPGSGNANYDNELWHLADVMQKTWLSGNTVSTVRFPLGDVDSTLNAWGLTNIQTSETGNLTDEVALFNALDLTAVNTFIDTSLYPVAPISGTTTTVLLAGEESYRTVYLGTIEAVDINSVPTVITRTLYADSVLTVDLTGKEVSTDGMLRWQPYQFDGVTWQPADLGATVDQLGPKLQTVFSDPILANYQLINATAPATQFDPAYDTERQGAALLAQNFYLAMAAGVNAPLIGPAPTEIVNADYLLPTETAAAIVNQLTNKVKNAFVLLNLNGQDFPTVDSATDMQGADAWQGLASSLATVTKAYGQLAVGTDSSALSQALTELAYLPRISIEQGSYDYLTDATLIFANENGRARLGGIGSGTFKSVLATTYPLASGAMAAYGHMWYADQAVMKEIRVGVLLDPQVSLVLSNIENQKIRMIAINDQMLGIQAEIENLLAQNQLQLSSFAADKIGYIQEARSKINFYLQDSDVAAQKAAKAMGFADAGANALPPSLAIKYDALQVQLVDLDGKMTQTINKLDGSEAFFKKNYPFNPDDLSPVHALKAARIAKAWGLIGVATSTATAGLTIGLALANGRFQPDSPQFSRFLAEQIAGIIVDVFIAILDVLIIVASIAVLGAILAVIAVVDAVIGAVCAATKFAESDPTTASWICGGITGALAKGLSYVINDTTPLVDLGRADRLELNIGAPVLGNETGIAGMVAGNSVTLTGTVTSTLYMNDPNWLGYVSGWQWKDGYLDDSTFAYKFQPTEQSIPLDLNGTNWSPSPDKKANSFSANDARFFKQFPIGTYSHTFVQPGINKGLPVYFSEGFAVQQQNCWLLPLVCWLTKYDDTTHQPLENTFVFDVWPASIDEFQALVLQPANNDDNGYRLAWDTTFPTLADADGDGLRSQALKGPDPDDSNPDSDGDGLPDSFEVATAGFDPMNGDSDCDGLTDYWELFYGTNPALKDSDGDGLTDNEEHFHPNQIYPYDNSEVENLNAPLCSTEKTVYTGGWNVVYDYDSNGNPLLVRVSADPLDPDSDDDNLTDKQERIYAYNPNVASKLNVLSLDSTIESASSNLPYVSPGSVVSYTAVVTNELTLPYARGLVETELPLDNVLRFQSTQAIAPRTAVTVTGSVGLAEAGLNSTGPVNMAIRAGAKLDDPTGRVLWLHLNDNPGSTTFADVSFLQNDGSCSGASCPVANNQQLTFDGHDVVVVPDTSDLDLSQFTLALAFKPTTASQTGTLISKGADFYVNQNYYLAYNSNSTITFVTSNSCGSSNGIVNSLPLPLNLWSHVTATYDGSSMALYINGKLVGSSAYSGALCNNNQPVLIGSLKADGSGSQGFVGQIDEVEIYPTALNAGTILDRYATPLLQVNMRDGNTWGSADVSCSGAACPSVGAGGATFNQVDHLVATAPDLSNDAFAFATWIRPQARTYPFSNVSATAHGKWTDADYQGIFGYQPTSDSKTIFPSLYVGSNGRLRMIWGDGTMTCEVASANTNVLAVNNTWQHLAVSYDGSSLTFYVNGEPIPGGTTGSCAAVTPPNVSNFYIGRPNEFGYLYFNQMSFANLNDAAGIGNKAEMRLNFDSDSSSGNLAWSNLTKGTSSWTLEKTAVVNENNSWFRVWDNRDGGCFITCPEDDSTDTNYDQDQGRKDTSITQITGINSTTYLGEQSSGVSMPACGNLCLPAIIGSMTWSNYNDYFKGTLDDFRVYGYALTDAVVDDIFHSTSTALDLTFDEAPGSSLFADQSGNAITVSCSGDTCPTSGVPGRFNQALEFDGIDDYLTIGASSTALGTSEGSFTAMMWIKPDTFWGTNDDGILPLIEVGSYDLGLYGYGRPGVSYYRWTNNFTLYSATGRWYHLAYVFENGIYTFYVNGENKGSTTYGQPGAENTLRIGQDGFHYFDGLMDDLTVVKRALTADEVKAHFNRVPAVNLHLDEGLKTNNGVVTNQGIHSFIDDSENRYVATCTSVDTCPDAGDKGQIREAVAFDGNDTLTLAQTDNLALTDFSVGLWVKPTKTTTTPQRLVTKSSSNYFNANFRLWLLGNSLTVRFDRQFSCLNSEGNWHWIDATTPLLENQWNHVLATHDATNGEMKIYINGALSGTASGTGHSICTGVNPIRLGQAFSGGMDEVIVAPSVLSASAVADLYDYQAAWYDVINQHSLYIDADLPTVDLSKTATTLNAEQTVLYIGADDATSPVTTVEYRIDGGSWQQAQSANNQAANSAAWTFYFQQDSGVHLLEARATDAGGNVSAIESTTIVVDRQAPTITISNSSAVVQAVGSTPLNGTAVDGESGVPANGVTVRTFDWQNEPVGGNLFAELDAAGDWQVSQPFETAPYGSYDVVATAQDEVGNSATTTQTINLDGLPPYADVTKSDNYFVTTSGEMVTGVAGETPYPSGSRTLHLHFEDGAGLWADGSETKFEMLCGDPTCPTSGIAGKRGTAISFDGIDDMLSFGGNEAITTTVTAGQLGLLDGSFTVMAWVKADDWTGNFPILGSSPITPSDGLTIGLNDGFPTFGYVGDDTTLSEAIPTGEWVHIAWRFDAAPGERSFFVNGVAVGDPTTGHSALSAEDEIELGRARGSNYYGGALDELVIFASPLDAETIYDIAHPVNSTVSEMSLRIRSYEERDIGRFAGTWNPVTLDTPDALYTTWQYALPTLAQNVYKIDLSVTDSSGNTSFVDGAWDLGVTEPDVAVSKQTDATLVGLGDAVTFTINYTNTGLASASGVILREVVPVDSSFNAALSDAGWNCTPDGSAGNECTLTVGTLAAGESGSAAFAVTAANAWSAGTIAIANTVTIDVDGNDSMPADNVGTAEAPIDGGVDLAVSIVSDGKSLYYADAQPTPVYTITYSNLSTDQTAIAELVEPLPPGLQSNYTNYLTGWRCSSIYTGGTCTYQLGEVTPGAGGTVTFTFSSSFKPPPTNVVTNTVSIRDVSGVTDFNPANDEASVTTPFVLDFAIVPSQEAVVVNEGATAVLTGTVVDSSGAWSMLYPGPSVGTITQDDLNLSWTWMYTTTDGLDESQTVSLAGIFNEGGVMITHTFPLTVVNVVPTLAVTGTDQVAAGATYNLALGTVFDPGTDTVTACNLDWGDGVSNDCLANLGGGSLDHVFGNEFGYPVVTVNLTDEDGTHIAATKQVTVTGVPIGLSVDQATVGGYESQVVTNTGTYTPQDATFGWSASEGTVVDEGSGVWSWSLPAGSAEGSRTVTITADGSNAEFTVDVLGDGAASNLEDGAPNGGDGNNDGTPDKAQMNVASLPSPLTGQYVTLAASPGMTLTNVAFPAAPIDGAGSLPADINFPLGFPTFNLTGMGVGGSANVTVFLTSTAAINTYYKYDATNGWYEFDYDLATDTGAELVGNTISLYFVDGARGDSDLSANGIVTDPGGPAFKLVSYDLTVSTTGSGSVSIPSGSYPAGTVLNLQAVEDPGWSFSKWQGALSGSQISETLTMDQDQSVMAIFKPLAYTLDVVIVGDGAVAKTPLKTTYAYNDLVALSATAATGWSFSAWSGDLASGNAAEQVTIDSNKVVTATFTQDIYTVSTGVSGSGSVVINPDQAGYLYGDVVSVLAVPDPGNRLQSWSGDLSGAGAGRSLTIDGNKSVTAIFATETYTVETSTIGNGTILVDPVKSTYSYGDVITATAVPAADWQLSGWTLGLSGIVATQSLTVTGNTDLQAVFAPITYKLNVGWTGVGTVEVLSDKTEFTAGEVVSVTATTGIGHTFTGWREQLSETLFSTSITATVTMTEDKSIVAVFTPITYTLDVNLAGSGSVAIGLVDVTCVADCSNVVSYGSVISMTAVADLGSTFSGWSGDVSSPQATVTVTVTADTQVTATFGLEQRTLTVATDGTGSGGVASDPAGISCSTPGAGDCTANFDYGTVVTLTATADSGSVFDGWSGACNGVGDCLVTMEAAQTVTATFGEIPLGQFALTVNLAGNGAGTVTGTGINCFDGPGADCTNSYTEGTVVTLTATADGSSLFTAWSGACGGTGSCVVTMNAAQSVTANFTLKQYQLSAAVDGSGSGNIGSDPAGISCPGDCAEIFNYGTVVTLTAVVDTGSTFAGWEGACTNTSGDCVVTMSQAQAVTATFTLNQYALTVSIEGSGAGSVSSDPVGIDCGGDCSEDYAYGTVVTLTAVADTGSTFAGWGGACTNTSGDCVVTMSQAQDVTATFLVEYLIYLPMIRK